jgi:integral membrane protein
LNGALRRYQIAAYAVGTGLLILVLIGVPLQYGAGHPGVVKVVGPIHGFLYIIYLALAFDLARRAVLAVAARSDGRRRISALPRVHHRAARDKNGRGPNRPRRLGF